VNRYEHHKLQALLTIIIREYVCVQEECGLEHCGKHYNIILANMPNVMNLRRKLSPYL